MKKTDLSGVDAKALSYIALTGLFRASSWTVYFKALSLGEASLVIPIDRSSVLFAVVFSLFWAKKQLSKTALGSSDSNRNNLSVLTKCQPILVKFFKRIRYLLKPRGWLNSSQKKLLLRLRFPMQMVKST